MHCVDLGESFPTHILLQNLASIQPRTGPVKFARSPRTDPPGRSPFPSAELQPKDIEDLRSYYDDFFVNLEGSSIGLQMLDNEIGTEPNQQ